MKRILAIVMLLTVLLGCLLAPIGASAETTVTGKNNKTVTFKIKATRKNAYFVLSSSTGLAKVAQHNWLGRYKGDGNEVTHGFYKVTVKGKGIVEIEYESVYAVFFKEFLIYAQDVFYPEFGFEDHRQLQ